MQDTIGCRIIICLHYREATKAALADARVEQVNATNSKVLSLTERADRFSDSRDLQAILQADLDNHERGKEAMVVDLRSELVDRRCLGVACAQGADGSRLCWKAAGLADRFPKKRPRPSGSSGRFAHSTRNRRNLIWEEPSSASAQR